MSPDAVLDIESPYIDRDESQSSLLNWRALWATSWKLASQFLQFKSGPGILKDIFSRGSRLLSM
ncbi:hypothetical protein N7450_011555 [Penicillium hetheringtonii]|uniref:Uncharacterized protein n=1 Tax=Penicillium hetheringtonii TaxID=911720 RepID=A0AAD6DCA9_9EURO|nr:hypothetical protein N7450_011555 [Penicillium hetheringtonii]